MTDNIKVAFSKHGSDLFDVRHFSVREAINELFTIELAVVSHQEDIDFDTIVGKEAAVFIDGLKPRVWAGVVAEITQVHGELASEKKSSGGKAASSYQLTIMPNFWRATLRKNSRVYQHLSTKQIAEKLLGEWGITPDVSKLKNTYKPHEYCVQYQETDYAFLCRLMEDAGINFYFSHEKTQGTGADITKLILNDTPEKNPVYEGQLCLVSSHQLNIGVPFMACANVAITQRLRPGKFAIRDFDFRSPLTTPLLATATVGTSPTHEDKLEQYHYLPSAFWWEGEPGGGTPVADDRGTARTDKKEAGAKISGEKDQAQVLVKREMDAERRRKKVVTFTTNAIDLAVGGIVGINQNATETDNHPRKELAPDKTLLVYETHFEGHAHGDWVQRAVAVFSEFPSRPERRTPRPRVYGVQSALVVGPKGKEVWTDEFGRVRLQFHWDREGKYDDGSTCWVRVSQQWAGNGFGAIHHPRVGHEVLVEFFEGDPDQPVIVGRVYNNTSYGGALLPGVPYALPDHATRTAIKTDSSPGGHGYNELYFEDAKGHELIHIQAEKDISYVVNNSESSAIGGSRTTVIGTTDTIDVGKTRAVTVKKIYKTSVGETYTVSVAKQTTFQMVDKTIVQTTGKSSLSLAEASIWLNADAIHMHAGTEFEITTQTKEVIVQGGPHVRVNEAGAGPAPKPIAAIAARDPSPPGPGGTSGSPYFPSGGMSLTKPGGIKDSKVDTGIDMRSPPAPTKAPSNGSHS